MPNSRFATAVNCIDGRVQLPVIEFLRLRYDVDYVDMITGPGIVKTLAESTDESLKKSLKPSVEVSVEKHGSRLIAVVAHYDCAGNPVDKERQTLQAKAGMRKIQSWGFDVKVVGLWVDGSCRVHRIGRVSKSARVEVG